MQARWDIFCKIVDNLGDIGVCWRLCRQLNVEHGLQVRLWVDDWAVAQQLIPSLKSSTQVDGVTILHWHDTADFTRAADVVIEAFACGLPKPYLTLMSAQKTKWVTLEYLSAEAWVDDFHGKPSPQASGLTRHFYFPGFSEKTGGLIRSSFDSAISSSFDSTRDERLNIPVRPELVEGHALNISLFCYPNAPIDDVFNTLKANNHAVVAYVPKTTILPNIAKYFGKNSVQVGERLTQNNLTVDVLPFLSQAEYDVLLRTCDLNFVRGEDSWIRAIWAGKPFIWQPYVQTENTHLTKLNAFLDVFYADFIHQEMLCKAHGYWATGQGFAEAFQVYLTHLPAICAYTQAQATRLAQQPDLATKLVNFCNKL